MTSATRIAASAARRACTGPDRERLKEISSAYVITLIDIVEAMEGPLGMTQCSLHEGACGIESSCGVRANWRRINDVVVDALRGVTLADMLQPPHPTSADASTAPGRRAIPATLATA